MNELAGRAEKNNPVDARPRDGVQIVEKRRQVYFNGIGHPRCGNRRIDAAGRTYWLAFHPAHIPVVARIRASTVYELYCGWELPRGVGLVDVVAYGPMPLHGLIHQFAWIEQMLRPVMLARPAASLRQFHTEKVAHFQIAAVADSSYKLSIPVMHSNVRPCRDRAFHLKAY